MKSDPMTRAWGSCCLICLIRNPKEQPASRIVDEARTPNRINSLSAWALDAVSMTWFSPPVSSWNSVSSSLQAEFATLYAWKGASTAPIRNPAPVHRGTSDDPGSVGQGKSYCARGLAASITLSGTPKEVRATLAPVLRPCPATSDPLRRLGQQSFTELGLIPVHCCCQPR